MIDEHEGVGAVKDIYRNQARWRVIENVLRDVRFALRQFRGNPGFTAAAVISLALGIGANTALFSFINAILLRQLPVPSANRLVLLKENGREMRLRYDQLNALSRNSTQLEGLLGTFPLDVSVTIAGDEPQWVSAELVSGDYFRTLAIKAARGRLLTQHDLENAQGDPVCVISYRFWQRQLRGAEDVLNRTIRLNTRPYRIIGVSEPNFRGADLQRRTDLQIPATRLPDYMPAFASDPHFDWHSRLSIFATIGRLRPDANRASAAAELTRLNQDYLQSIKRDRSEQLELADGSGGFRSSQKLVKPASILLAVALLVLLIACANLAALLLARTSARSFEFALRLAIGGSRLRIAAQMLVENGLLANFGATAGIALAFAIRNILLSFLNRTAPAIHRMQIGLDAHVLGFAAALSIICLLLFGSVPAIQASRTSALGSSAGNTRTGAAIRKIFVVVQIALSFVVVLTAGLLAGTLRNLKTIDLGYSADEVTAIDIRPATGGYTGAHADQFYTRVLEKLRSTPGIRAASTALSMDFGSNTSIKLEGNGRSAEASVFAVGPGYFETFGERLLAGRDFNQSDKPNQPQVYIISEHLAKKLFPDGSAVGNILRWNGEAVRVVGIVSDVRGQDLRAGGLDMLYDDVGQLLTSSLTVYVHCAGPCQPLLPTIRAAVRAVDANTPILAMHTLRTLIEGAFSSEEMLGFLSTLFAALAMLLVATGLYGVLSFMLTRRTREMGIRIALGASSGSIAKLFAREAIEMTIGGMAIGIPAGLAAVWLLRSQLFGVAPHDPATVAACSACILITIATAASGPIRRAIRIQPQQALRSE